MATFESRDNQTEFAFQSCKKDSGGRKRERQRKRERGRETERERCIINNAHIDKVELDFFQYGSMSFITLQFFFE